jgi:hypothetical protein
LLEAFWAGERDDEFLVSMVLMEAGRKEVWLDLKYPIIQGSRSHLNIVLKKRRAVNLYFLSDLVMINDYPVFNYRCIICIQPVIGFGSCREI